MKWRLAIALLVVALAGLLATTLAPRNDLGDMLPRSAEQLRRNAEFFTQRSAAQVLLLEAVGGDERQRRFALEEMAAALADHGAAPRATGDARHLSALLSRIWQQLPHLTDSATLAAASDSASIHATLQRYRDLLTTPGNELLASACYRDVLGLSWRFLDTLRERFPLLASDRRSGAVVAHPDQDVSLLPLKVAFPPNEHEQAEALMLAANDWLAQRPADATVAIEVIGPYRNFVDNASLVWRDLYQTLPISLIVIAFLLRTLLGSWRAILAMHVPALAAASGAVIALAMTGSTFPLVVLGFGAGVFGIAVDYGIHMASARGAGREGDLWRPLLAGFCTTAAAFGVLLTSSIPALGYLSMFVIGALLAALLATLFLLPGLVPMQNREAWPRLGGAVRRLNARRPYVWLAVGAVLTLALTPGLNRLHFEDDPQRLDGSSAATVAAMDAFQQRWGSLTGNTFIVVDADSARAAAAVVADLRAEHGLPPSLLTSLLPAVMDQQRHWRTWQRWWGDHADTVEARVDAVAGEQGLRATAFAPSFAQWRRDEPPPLIDRATWDETPLAEAIATAVETRADGSVQLVDTVRQSDPQRIDALVETTEAEPGGPWVASRRALGRELVQAVGRSMGDLLGLTAAAVGLALLVMLGSWRRSLAVFISTAAALWWTFGLFGYLGMSLTPLHVLVATFVAGIGIDDGVFLSDSRTREHSFSPVMATTATSIAGVGAMAFAAHPVVSAIGIALAIGMSACLLSCLCFLPVFMRWLRVE